MSSPKASRRHVVRTSAWALPAVTVVGAAPQLAASTVDYTDTQPRTATYHVSDTWWFQTWITVRDVPVSARVGDQIKAPSFAINISVPPDFMDGLRGSGAVSVEGLLKPSITGAGHVAPLVIPNTPIGAVGESLWLSAQGTGSPTPATATGPHSIRIAHMDLDVYLVLGHGSRIYFPWRMFPIGGSGSSYHLHTYDVT